MKMENAKLSEINKVGHMNSERTESETMAGEGDDKLGAMGGATKTKRRARCRRSSFIDPKFTIGSH